MARINEAFATLIDPELFTGLMQTDSLLEDLFDVRRQGGNAGQ
mgnify:CR=1 FL=1